MNYPVWDLPFAHGLLIAVVAITHVFVSHFAVGGGLYLVITEHLARRRNDTALMDTLHGHTRFFMLLTLVFGAISGVGIWFTIALINPAGTSALIHAFVWGWAIEWTFFVTEVAAAMFYYYGWKRLSPGHHLAVGWIYFIAAWASMIIINGILSFQLTPGAWLETRAFWDGFFNPTYWSSLMVRTFYAIAIAGMFALWTASTRKDLAGQKRTWLVRFSGVWSILGVIGTAACTLWWWADVPADIRQLAQGDMPFASSMVQWAPILTAALAVLVILFPLLIPKAVNRPVALLVLLAGFLVMGAGEWAREGLRKPFVVYDYIYSTGELTTEIDALKDVGSIAESALWVDKADQSDPVAWGEHVFRVQCMNCHARDGYNGMAGRVLNWNEEYIGAVAFRMEHTRRQMPPFVGSEEDAAAVGAYLTSLKPAGYTIPAMTTGEEVWDVRCAPCHSIDGTNPISDLFEGLAAEEMVEFMADLESDYMPAYTGSDAEAQLMADWLAGELTALDTDVAAGSTPSNEEAGR